VVPGLGGFLCSGESTRVRFRFSATTKGGEVRSGLVEAEDEAGARRQLERRGMTIESLTEDQSELPTFVKSDVGAFTNKMPLAPVAPSRFQINWAQVAWSRVLLALVLGGLCLGGLKFALGKLLAERTYHIRLTGEIHIRTGRKLPPTYWKTLGPRVAFPKLGWVVSRQGIVYQKDSKGKWRATERRARFKYEASVEGNYTIDLEIALPGVPENCVLIFGREGYYRVGRRGTFKIKDNVFTCQMSSMTLIPRSRARGTNRRTPRRTRRTQGRPS